MSIRSALGIGLATLLLLGCTSDKPDLLAFVSDVRSRPSPPIEPIPQIKPYTPYTYVAGERRAPFTRVIQKPQTQPTATSDLHPNLKRPLDPLEHFPLDALQMVGTLSVGGVRYALIHAPDDVVYRAQVGEHAGHDYGEITHITPTAVQLTEIVPDGMGGYMNRPASIPLSQ